MSSKQLTLILSTALCFGTATAYSQITPTGITLGPSQQQQFKVPGQQQWTWSVMPVGTGTISPTGLYTAPAIYQSSYVYIYARAGSMYNQTEVHLSQGMVSSTGSTSQSVGISVSPASIYLYGGQSAQFTASVSSSINTQVMWSITQGVGSLVNGLYTAPSSVSSDSLVTILATSMADPTKSASATILLGPAITPAVTTPAPSNVSITLKPRSASLNAGQSKQFNATVSGSSNSAVTWSLNPSVGTVSNGLYTAPATISATQTIQLTATSVADTTQSATTSIALNASVTAAPQTLPSPPPTSVSPATATVAPGGTGQFSVQNLPSGVIVAWSVNPAVGSIAASGLYTAPSPVAVQQILTITAKNSSTQAVLGTGTLTLTATPPPPPSVSPATATVAPSGTQQFTVQNLPSGTTVRWSISPSTGRVSSSGLYTAPSTVATQTAITVTAKNSSTQAVLGTATLTLTATPPPPSVTPATVTVGPSGTQQFNVQNLPSGVTVAWSASPATGSIASGGLYTAPSTVATQTAITVTAKNSSTQAVLGTATLTLTATPPPPSVTPATVTVGPSGTQQFNVQNLPSGVTVAWSVSPATGSIASGGLYTAPGTVATQTSITVTAKNSSTQAVLGTATLTLTATPPPPSVTPATVTVAPAGTQQFSVQNLPSGVTVAWSASPATGSIASGGLYTAPGTVASQTSITVTAKNSSTQAVLGTATLTLTATPPPPSVSPATVTVAPSGTKQFSVQNLPSGVTVAWSVSPATGGIASSGLYTAPSTVATQTALTITAKNSSTQAVLGTATLTLTATPTPSVSPATVTLAPSASQVFSVQNLPSGTPVTWSISPGTGIINGAGVYQGPGTLASQQTITVTAKNTSTQAVLGTAQLTLTVPPPPATTTTVTLPLEVVGADGTTSSASFSIPSGTNLSGPLQLWMQIHNVKYETEASVQVNNSAWMPISTATVTLLGNAAAFGGIGGGFHTLKMTLNLPPGVVTSGTNTITFRFNGTNGVVSGYRVLAFNIQSGGNNLLPSSQFVNDDPNTWQAPLADSSDIAAGLALYQGAALTAPGAGAIQAHCSDCHTVDGRDLKYFNYSNSSIEARATFHGLTAQQGAQIASYIRSLNVPNPGRPWNPPYQPGPGLDSQPVANWSAGAGIDAVLDSDADMVPYMAPGGSTAGWSATSYLNAREMPTSLQLLDWNSWLPVVHPMDAFGTAFTSSPLNLDLLAIRNNLQPNSPTTYKNAMYPLQIWFTDRTAFLTPYSPTEMPLAVYSVAQWQLVKMWELNQDFGLEGMPQALYGAKADVRGWYGGLAFGTAPNILHLPAAIGVGNGSALASAYLSLIWYHAQLILNDGQGTQTGHDPIDYGYALSFVRAVFTQAQLPGSMELMEFLIKDLQEVTLTGVGPQEASLGWHVTNTSPFNAMVFTVMPLWSATSPALQTTFMQAYLQAWLDQASKYTPQQYYQGGWATPTENPATDAWSTTFGGQLWYMLPRLRYMGVSDTLLDQVSAWGASLFPQGNWALSNSTSCGPVSGPCATGI